MIRARPLGLSLGFWACLEVISSLITPVLSLFLLFPVFPLLKLRNPFFQFFAEGHPSFQDTAAAAGDAFTVQPFAAVVGDIVVFAVKSHESVIVWRVVLSESSSESIVGHAGVTNVQGWLWLAVLVQPCWLNRMVHVGGGVACDHEFSFADQAGGSEEMIDKELRRSGWGSKDVGAVTTPFFGLIHGKIGLADQFGRVVALVRAEGDADADSDLA